MGNQSLLGRLATMALHHGDEWAQVHDQVSELIAVAEFAALLKFKQSRSNANAAFLDYRDCIHLQTLACAAIAAATGAK